MGVPKSSEEGGTSGAGSGARDVLLAPGRQPGDSLREAAQPQGSDAPWVASSQPIEPLFQVEVRDEDDLASLQRRSRQIGALLGFDVSQQTEIGTAVSVLIRPVLTRACVGKVEFSASAAKPAGLCVRIEELGSAEPVYEEFGEDQRAIRVARELMGEVESEISPAGNKTTLLRRALPEKVLLDSERVQQVREALARAVPKSLVQELRDQNRELRELQGQLVVSETSLRQRIRQAGLLAEIAAVLIGPEPTSAKLQNCANQIAAHLAVDCASIWSADSGGERLALSGAAGNASRGFRPQGESPNSQLARVVQQRRPYITDSLLEDFLSPEWHWAARHRLQTFAGYPLAIENKLLGVLAVYTRQPLGVEELDTLAVVAAQLAVGMERQAQMAERERLLESEREERLKAERATQSRDRLLAVVSHDLRNPLSSVVTAASLLCRSPVLASEPRLRKHVDTILHASERMKRLLSDLLDLASLESGRLTLTPARQSVAPLVSEVMQLHASVAEAKSIRLQVTVDDFLPEIWCDHGRVLQVLSNLIGNAIKFTPEGGAISVRAISSGSEVLLSISDTGPGMSEQELAHVFETYWQARPGSGQGVGLGLSIAKGLVDAQGGRIRVESSLGGGSTFLVSFPANRELPQAEQHLAG